MNKSKKLIEIQSLYGVKNQPSYINPDHIIMITPLDIYNGTTSRVEYKITTLAPLFLYVDSAGLEKLLKAIE